MNKHEQKDKIQANAVELSKKNRFLCLEWCTGSGKTRASLKIVKNMLKDNPDLKGYHD